MNKYERLQKDLLEKGTGKMKCFGNSMTPIIQSGSLLAFRKQEEYQIGDIVFCKVKGRIIDAHKIVAKGSNGKYLIANNHGGINGWTNSIYGKAYQAQTKEKNSTKVQIKKL